MLGREPGGGLLRVRIGSGELQVNAASPAGATLRVQMLARDIIVATRKPEFLSVRNHLKGIVTAVEDDGASDLISIDVGGGGGDDSGPTILARITKAATRELGLAPAKPVWALVKSVALRGVTSAGSPGE